MKKLLFMLIVISMLSAVPAAMAYKTGDLELTLGGGGSSDEEFEGTVFNIEAGL
jgi:hypothetical protein